MNHWGFIHKLFKLFLQTDMGDRACDNMLGQMMALVTRGGSSEEK